MKRWYVHDDIEIIEPFITLQPLLVYCIGGRRRMYYHEIDETIEGITSRERKNCQRRRT